MFLDSLIISKNVFTALSDRSFEACIGIKNGKISYLGNFRKAKKIINKKTKIINAKNNFVCPAFIDNHLHLTMAALRFGGFIVDVNAKSPKKCVLKLKKAMKNRKKDKFLLGFGWNHTNWKKMKLPDKKVIDKIFPKIPVALQSEDGHNLWLNSKALKILNINKNSIPPKGGKYKKNKKGELTGIIQDTAAFNLLDKIYDFSQKEFQIALDEFSKILAKNGVTSVCDMAIYSKNGKDLVKNEVYEKFQSKNKKLRINLYPEASLNLKRAQKLNKKFKNNPYIKFCGLKQFFDGVASSHTAWFSYDYENANFKGDKGYPSMPISDMKKLVFAANKRGFPVRIHAIGDKSISTIIDIFESSQAKFGIPRLGKNGIEHLEAINQRDLQRLKENQIMANVQPQHLTMDFDSSFEIVGNDRAKFLWPLNSKENFGVKTSFGSDCPVVPINSLELLYSAVVRKDPALKNSKTFIKNQKISMASALKNYTLMSANSCGREKELGSIEIGKLADLVILEKNPLKQKSEKILKNTILRTIIGGETIYKY